LRGSGRIVLSIDHSRAARALDPLGRQVFISCGAFIENLDIAAREFGYRADIDLFPAGWPVPGSHSRIRWRTSTSKRRRGQA